MQARGFGVMRIGPDSLDFGAWVSLYGPWFERPAVARYACKD